MGHFKGIGERALHLTPEPWAIIGRDVGILVNRWADRHDLIAYVDAGVKKEAGAAAAYYPLLAEIVVDTDAAFGEKFKPKGVDILSRKTQFTIAPATGAIFHEAMHARFTTWDLKDASEALTSNEFDAMMLLEESRMEAYGIAVLPEQKAFLRSAIMGIVIGDMKEQPTTSTRAAAQLAALVLARIDTRVLRPQDVEAIDTQVRDTLDADLLAKLRELWLEFQAQNHPEAPNQLKRMYEIAREWNKLVQDAAEEKGEGAERGDGEGFEGDGQDGGEQSSAVGQSMGDIMDALGEDAATVVITAQSDLDTQEVVEEMEASADQKQQKQKEREMNSTVFQKMRKNGPGPQLSGSRSRLTKQRQPTVEERRAAVALGRDLDKAKYQDRRRIDSKSAVPPGRLRMGAVMQAGAQRAAGNMSTVEPWRRVQRKHVDDPELKIGVMVDISGSMGGAMEPMGAAAWILSEASKRVEATLAMVYYGNGVFPTLLPGQHLDAVNIYSASDGTEKAETAFKALDGALDLLYGTGARLVVVVSDGQYVPEQVGHVKDWFKKFSQAGVGVLWLGYGNSDYYAKGYCAPYESTQYVEMGRKHPAEAGAIIGKAAVRAVNAAGQRRG